MYALKGCDKDESDVTFTAFCPSTLLSWSASPLESSGSAARQGNFFVFVICSNKRTLYLVMSARSVLYLIVTLVIRTHYIWNFLVTLVMSALSVLHLIAPLVIRAH